MYSIELNKCVYIYILIYEIEYTAQILRIFTHIPRILYIIEKLRIKH